MKKFVTILFILAINTSMFGQAFFNTSLHKTREGKNTAYRIENGGMEIITGIPMADLACGKCHSTTETYPNGDPIDPNTYQPSCNDCHNFAAGSTVAEQTCKGCHNRQVYEIAAYPDSLTNGDVHRKAGMACLSCHTKAEVHGDDGVAYASLKEDGAIQTKCINCHANMPVNTSHTLHSTKVDCAACHAVSVLTCAGCHFESVVATGKNRAINQIKNYRLLVKKNNMVRLGGFMSHSFNNKTNYIISSYHSHVITKNATTCTDCHQNMGGTNPAITEYNNTGFITMTTWNSTSKKIIGPSGVVPIPADWKTSLKLDFVTYTGDPTVFPSDPNAWVYLKSEVDNSHLFYCEPLDSSTLAKLGFTRFPTSIEKIDNNVPDKFVLEQNYPNPFNPNTTIRFSIPQSEIVSIEIYDVQGELVKSLLKNSDQSSGTFELKWDGKDDSGKVVPSGIYFTRMSAGKFNQVQKMVFLK
ncbi:MAG: hypothetical protein AUK34_03590 [Ignavibacteria bacterium CG2_30_36_16]|nr:T9SS type A sorting domain-containing protein [Ignavibacteria bacterium]OIP62294.1 MAG: hypothetical protein AUK34_03590 [Ignavibacteria bacterium CG2_30_36_16]PJB01752.1 MAG: hypothetical protein CO127_02215 [Ignavibacteria bacterium CG_4_9_14_3_um_filter_36_18]